MNVLDLDNKNLVCDSYQVRLVCGNPANHSWKRYRAIVGIKARARQITLRQAFLLWVCANLYRNGERKLEKSGLYLKANEVLRTKPESMQAIAILSGTQPINGKDIPEVIESVTGKKVSKRTIYRKCNSGQHATKFSVEASYRPEQIRRIMKAVTA